MIGPVARPNWPIPTFKPRKRACLRVGSTVAMVVMAPFASPAEPTPEITRPTINMGEVVAAPLIAEPTSNIRKNVRKVHYWGTPVRKSSCSRKKKVVCGLDNSATYLDGKLVI